MNEQRAYHFKPNPNLPTHYTLTLRNHENFSYGGGAQQVPRHGQNFQQGYVPLRFQQQQQGEGRNEYQGQKRAQTFEDQMLQFMGENKKLLNFHEQKFAELEASNTNSQIFQKTTNASLKNLETQIGQLALTLQNQMKDAFPSDTKKNPKDCMAVQLRSGKELEKEKSEKDEGNKEEGSLERVTGKRKKEGAATRRSKKQEESPELYACSHIPAETTKVKDRGAVRKVFENLPEVGDKHAIHRSGNSNSTLCQIPEGNSEQEEKICRGRSSESDCYLQCSDKEEFTREDERSRKFHNSLHHWRN